MSFKKSILFLVVLMFFSCQEKKKKTDIETEVGKQESAEANKSKSKHWSYMGETGPEYWAELEKDSACNGDQQSPIDIITVEAIADSSLSPISIHYSENVKLHDITNNGHSIQYNFDMGDYIMVNDTKYNLIQFHFHEASEHTINGVRYPLEMHLVHISDENKIAVLGIMAIEGANSEPFAFLEKHLPVQMGETKKINTDFNLSMNLPEDKSYYTYEGSLTTPPCTQSVSWFVFKNSITIAKEQVNQLKALMPMNNYRTEQALNNRKVKVYSSQ